MNDNNLSLLGFILLGILVTIVGAVTMTHVVWIAGLLIMTISDRVLYMILKRSGTHDN